MFLHGYIPKSKPKKLTKAEKQQHEEWLASINKLSEKRYSRSPITKTMLPLKTATIFVRETPKFDSLNTGFVPCVKKVGNLYTGDKIKGIGTMHKSNAVPVFSDNEAKEIASMRR
jgi:hypothetical protein